MAFVNFSDGEALAQARADFKENSSCFVVHTKQMKIADSVLALHDVHANITESELLNLFQPYSAIAANIAIKGKAKIIAKIHFAHWEDLQ